MIKFKNLPSLIQVYYSLHSILVHRPQFKRAIKTKSDQYHYQKQSNPAGKFPIAKLAIEEFQDKKSLARWGQVSDRQFGGDSIAQVVYNQYVNTMNLGGKIDITNKDKILTTPFIGMLQKTPTTFKARIFNSLRVQLIGDGNPVHCELEIFSPILGSLDAHAFILTQKTQNFVTYELPLRNFQLVGEQVSSQQEYFDKSRETVAKIMDTQYPTHQQFQISKISFRLISTISMTRSIQFKKIQLVRTMRGNRQNSKIYMKPYFYIVDEKQEQDSIMEKIDTGAFSFVQKK